MKGCSRPYCADVSHCMVPDNCGLFSTTPDVATGHALDALVSLNIPTICRIRTICEPCKGDGTTDNLTQCPACGGYGYTDESDASLRARVMAAKP
jgi:hypothetical protein